MLLSAKSVIAFLAFFCLSTLTTYRTILPLTNFLQFSFQVSIPIFHFHILKIPCFCLIETFYSPAQVQLFYLLVFLLFLLIYAISLPATLQSTYVYQHPFACSQLFCLGSRSRIAISTFVLTDIITNLSADDFGARQDEWLSIAVIFLRITSLLEYGLS